jgi:hypothetical protein
MTTDDTTNWYSCEKCGLPCDTLPAPTNGGGGLGGPAVELSLCCKAPVWVVIEEATELSEEDWSRIVARMRARGGLVAGP